MKILFIENAGHTSAGAYLSMIALIKELRKYNIVSHVALPDRAESTHLLEENDIPYVKLRECSYTQMISKTANVFEKIKMPFKERKVKAAAKKLVRYVQENEIDIIQDNTSACYLGYYLAKYTEKKHVWHIREFLDEDFGYRLWNREEAIKKMNASDALIFVSECVRDKYKNEVDNNICHTVHNGIEVNRFYDKDHKILEADNIKILSVGRLTEGKGQKVLAEALGILKQKYNIIPNVTFIGSHKDKGYVKEIEEIIKDNNLNQNIKLIESRADIENAYKENDIFCMASRCEAFGQVTVEAMLSGCLVVASDRGGSVEILDKGKYGVLFKSMDASDLAEKLYSVYKNKSEYQNIAEAGRHHAYEAFDIKIEAERIRQIYLSL